MLLVKSCLGLVCSILTTLTEQKRMYPSIGKHLKHFDSSLGSVIVWATLWSERFRLAFKDLMILGNLPYCTRFIPILMKTLSLTEPRWGLHGPTWWVSHVGLGPYYIQTIITGEKYSFWGRESWNFGIQEKWKILINWWSLMLLVVLVFSLCLFGSSTFWIRSNHPQLYSDWDRLSYHPFWIQIFFSENVFTLVWWLFHQSPFLNLTSSLCGLFTVLFMC